MFEGNVYYVYIVVILNNANPIVSIDANMTKRPVYCRTMYPAENVGVSIMAVGEGWHNYHHVFPWDYKAAELGSYSTNITTALIDLMAKIGWAYDLKSVSPEMIKSRVRRTGDGSHELWGWDDKDQTEKEKSEAVVTYKRCD